MSGMWNAPLAPFPLLRQPYRYAQRQPGQRITQLRTPNVTPVFRPRNRRMNGGKHTKPFAFITKGQISQVIHRSTRTAQTSGISHIHGVRHVRGTCGTGWIRRIYPPRVTVYRKRIRMRFAGIEAPAQGGPRAEHPHTANTPQLTRTAFRARAACTADSKETAR